MNAEMPTTATLANGIGVLSAEDTDRSLNLSTCSVCGRPIDPDNDLFAGELIAGLQYGPLFWGIERTPRIVIRCWPCEQSAFQLR